MPNLKDVIYHFWMEKQFYTHLLDRYAHEQASIIPLHQDLKSKLCIRNVQVYYVYADKIQSFKCEEFWVSINSPPIYSVSPNFIWFIDTFDWIFHTITKVNNHNTTRIQEFFETNPSMKELATSRDHCLILVENKPISNISHINMECLDNWYKFLNYSTCNLVDLNAGEFKDTEENLALIEALNHKPCPRIFKVKFRLTPYTSEVSSITFDTHFCIL